jgi:hypothetical protein
MKQYPKIGSKVTFTGTHTFWFTNIIKDADELLEVGKQYTVSKVEPYSSWCSVVLEEFPDKKFTLGFFEYEKELTIKEVREMLELEYKTLEELRYANK